MWESPATLVHFVVPIPPGQSVPMGQGEFRAVPKPSKEQLQSSTSLQGKQGQSSWGTRDCQKNKAIAFAILIKVITLKIVG